VHGYSVVNWDEKVLTSIRASLGLSAPTPVDDEIDVTVKVFNLVDGRDIGQAFASAATEPTLSGYESLNIIGPESPTVRELIGFLRTEFGYPEPHFSIPFPVAYTFAAFLETVHRFLLWDPLVTRSVVYLLEDAHLTNADAYRKIGYQPQIQWREAVQAQVEEMAVGQARRMKMYQSVR
jgi:nucleoside-diphosphate-sugar epimerase